MTKVVYNDRHGGFSISKECAEFMAYRGCTHAQSMLKRYDDEAECVRFWYGHYDGPRHNLNLVEAVETIGFGAGRCDGENIDLPVGRKPQLNIARITGEKYVIEEYDGMEKVVEPKDIKWVVVQN